MSSATYAIVRVLAVEAREITLTLFRVPEPPFDDLVSTGLALMLLHEASIEPQLPPGALADELAIEEMTVDDPVRVARYIESCTALARRNQEPDFYANCERRFGDDHDAYERHYADESHLFQIDIRIRVLDARWIAHLQPGTQWSSVAYAPEIYR